MNNHFTKISSILFLSIVLLLPSCTKETSPDSIIQMDREIINATDEVISAPLAINLYLDGTGNNYMPNLIEQFKKEHPEVIVNITDYSQIMPDDYRTKLASELMTGAGPDVLLIINDGNETTDYMPDMTKMIQNDVFLDVNTLNVDFSSCNRTAMKIGEYQGEQIIIPLNYSLGFLYSTEERMEEAGIIYYDGITLAEFSSAFPAFYENNPDRKAFLHYLGAQFLFPHNSVSLIDYETGRFQAPAEGLPILEQYTTCFDNLFPDIFGSSEKVMEYMFYRNITKYGNTDPDIYHSGDLLFLSGRGFNGTYDTISMYNNNVYPEDIAKGETPVLFPMPTITGEMPSPRMTYGLVVNAQTENTEAVEKFIETAISMEFQYFSGGAGIFINQELVDRMEQFYLTEGYDPKDPFMFPKTCEYDKAFVESYFHVLDNMSDPIPYMDRTSSSYVFSIIRNAITGSMALEDAYASAKSQLEFYLSE